MKKLFSTLLLATAFVASSAMAGDDEVKVGSLKIGPTKFSIDENWRYDVC